MNLEPSALLLWCLIFIFLAKLLFATGRFVSGRRSIEPENWWLGKWRESSESDRLLIFYPGHFLDIDSMRGQLRDYQLRETEEGGFWLESEGAMRKIERIGSGFRIASERGEEPTWINYQRVV